MGKMSRKTVASYVMLGVALLFLGSSLYILQGSAYNSNRNLSAMTRQVQLNFVAPLEADESWTISNLKVSVAEYDSRFSYLNEMPKYESWVFYLEEMPLKLDGNVALSLPIPIFLSQNRTVLQISYDFSVTEFFGSSDEGLNMSFSLTTNYKSCGKTMIVSDDVNYVFGD